jgi:hypothetical protein
MLGMACSELTIGEDIRKHGWFNVNSNIWRGLQGTKGTKENLGGSFQHEPISSIPIEESLIATRLVDLFFNVRYFNSLTLRQQLLVQS